MASDILLGFLLGMAVVGGPQIALYILKLRRQVDFLTNGNPNVPVEDYPNRKENS